MVLPSMRDAPVKFHVSIPSEAVKLIFGFMGTHIQMGGDNPVFFQLESNFHADSLGRKITVSAPTTRLAVLALVSFIYELTHMSVDRSSGWMYVDPKEEVHGPYPTHRISQWMRKRYFDEYFPVMLHNPVVAIWIPAFMVEALTGVLESNDQHSGMETAEFVAMRDDDPSMDWEQTFDEDVAAARRQVHEIHSSAFKVGTDDDARLSSGLGSVADHHASTSMPMDYDACDYNVFGGIEKSVHVCVVLDTNVLLSHFSFLERRFGEIMYGKSTRGNVITLILVIPWVVLCELDHLKEGRLRDSALYAIKRIHTLASVRDSYVYIQGAASHKQAVEEAGLIDGHNQSLRNDDFIMQTCVFFKDRLVKKMREKKHRAHCVLISNDRGLQLRARANGIACLKAVEVESNVDTFLDAIDTEHGDCDIQCDRNIEGPVAAQGVTNTDAIKPTKNPATPLSKEVEDFLSSLQLQASEPPNLPHAHSSHPTGQNIHQDLRTSRPRHDAVDGSETKSIIALPVIVDAVQHGLGAFVRYMRQQDLGDLWDDLLEDELKWPGWEASDVLKVLTRHSSTFWGVFDRRLLDEAKTLLRYLHPSRFDAHAHECAIIAKKLLNASYSAFSKPISETQTDPPDPATVRGFISLGDAKAAVKESIDALDGKAYLK